MIADTGNSIPVKTSELKVSEDFVTKPVCPPQTNTEPQIFVAPAIMASGHDAQQLNAIQAWAVSIDDTKWQVHMRLLAGKTSGANNWVYPTAEYNRILAITMCAKAAPVIP
ncbi:MAG: hypothetical protein LBC94_00330 [Desulfovibrio sp.]|nr:hypothetical protein [Desulfovibrio sp.]